HSFPIDLPVRTLPNSPSVSPNQSSKVNCITSNLKQKQHITKSNDEFRPKYGIHVFHHSDGGIDHNCGPSTSNSVHSIPIPRQGIVNDLLSKFDVERTSRQENIVNDSTNLNDSTNEIVCYIF
ncbi:2504_t:CDS:2, partial [Scutellospora calospora]